MSGFVPLPDLRKNGPKIIRIGITNMSEFSLVKNATIDRLRARQKEVSQMSELTSLDSPDGERIPFLLDFRVTVFYRSQGLTVVLVVIWSVFALSLSEVAVTLTSYSPAAARAVAGIVNVTFEETPGASHTDG